jgi:hypothetical protein
MVGGWRIIGSGVMYQVQDTTAQNRPETKKGSASADG